MLAENAAKIKGVTLCPILKICVLKMIFEKPLCLDDTG